MKIVLIVLALFATVTVVSGVLFISVVPDGFLKSLAPEAKRTEVRAQSAVPSADTHGRILSSKFG